MHKEELIQAFQERVIDFNLNKTWAKENGVNYVYVESAFHFSLEDCQQIAEAFQYMGYDECFVIALEELGPSIAAFRSFKTTDSGIESFKFETEYHIFNVVLTSGDGKCFIICSVDDYFVVCGPLEFVRIAVGGDIEKVKKDFKAYVTSSDRSPRQREFLERISKE